MQMFSIAPIQQSSKRFTFKKNNDNIQYKIKEHEVKKITFTFRYVLRTFWLGDDISHNLWPI